MAGENVRDDERLDGEGVGDAALGEHVAHDFGHAEVGEGLLGRHMAPTVNGDSGDSTGPKSRFGAHPQNKNLTGSGAARAPDGSNVEMFAGRRDSSARRGQPP